MIVSHANEFIFIKTRKTAGTSIEIALSNFCKPEDIITSLSKSEEKMKENLGLPGSQNTLVPLMQYRRWDVWNLLTGGGRAHHFNHTSAELARKRVGEETFERYHKFCVVRNPWDRAVSQFFFEKYGEGMPGLPEDLAFSDYLTTLPDTKLSDSWLYTIGGSLAVDRVLRYENLAEEWSNLLLSFGFDYMDLPRAKSENRRTKKHYSHFYDEVSLNRVNEICKWEISNFGYTFENQQG